MFDPIKGMIESQMKKLEKIDVDHNGKSDLEEIKAAAAELQKDLAVAEEVLGYLSKIDPKELEKFLQINFPSIAAHAKPILEKGGKVLALAPRAAAIVHKTEKLIAAFGVKL